MTRNKIENQLHHQLYNGVLGQTFKSIQNLVGNQAVWNQVGDQVYQGQEHWNQLRHEVMIQISNKCFSET